MRIWNLLYMLSEERTRSLLELMVKISREVASALDLRTVLQRVLYASLQYVGGERGSIVVMDDLGKPVDATIVFGKQLHEHTTQQLKDTVERGLAGWVMQNRKAALLPDTSRDERWLRRADDATEKSGSKSAICVPLITRERFVGVLTLVHSVPNTFNEEHLELMQAIADQASVAVLNARLHSETQRTARVKSALAEGAAAINTSLEMPEVLRRILNQTMQALQVETVALALSESTTNDLVFQAAAGNNSGNIPGSRIFAGQGLAGKVVHEGQGLVVPNVRLEPAFSDADRLSGVEMRGFAIAPIQAHGNVLGVIIAANPLTGTFDPDALVVMTGLGSLAGTTIENSKLFEQLHNAHRHYRELFEDSVDPIVITNWNGKVLEVNRQAALLSGYTSEQLHTMGIDHLHEVNWSKTGQGFEFLRNGSETCTYESGLYRQDGGTLAIEVYARRVEFDDAEAIQWILRDNTARKDLDALRDDMTSMIFHDLRSPLGNIVSSLEMMSTLMPADETLNSMLNIARNSTGRIQRLVNSLLDINRLEAGQQIVDQNSIDPVALVRESIRDVEPSVAARQHTLTNRAKSVMPLVWVDVDMIYRVLINLMENAIKFTPVGGKIDIGAQTSPDGLFVKFWVRDNGPGIPQAERDRIFEKFTRLRGKNRPGGLGVGLAFCRLAVHGHGGEIWLESEVGMGTTFWLTLPVAKRQSPGQLKRQTGRLTFKPDKPQQPL